MSRSTDAFPDRGTSVFAVATATLVLSALFVFSRLVCRLAIVRRVGWDDYFIIASLLLAFGLCFTIDYGTRKGLGRYDSHIPADDRSSLRRSEYVFSILYNPALMATKTSILIFYLRLSKNTQQLLRLGSYAVLAIVNIAGIVLTFLNIFQCRPVSTAFDQVNGRCIPLLTEFICSAPVNIVTDLAILALPIPVLTSMRLPRRQKTILVLTFGLGIFITVVDVVRIYYLQQAINVVHTTISTDPNSIFGNSEDFSWNASLSLMWSSVEVNVGITCACIPTLKPLIIKIFPSMLLDSDESTHLASSRTREPDVSETASRVVTHRQRMVLFSPRSVDGPSAAASTATETAPNAPASGDITPTQSSQAVNLQRSHTRRCTAAASSVGSNSGLDMDMDSNADAGGEAGTTGSLGSNGISATDHSHGEALPSHSGLPSQQQQQEESLDDPMSATDNTRKMSTTGTAGLAKVTSGTRNATGRMLTRLRKTTSKTQPATRQTRWENAVYFGFVNMKRPTSMLDTTVSDSIKYCTVVGVLVFLWGFSYGLLNTLNNVVAAVANMTTAQTLGLTSAYFGGGYFFGPLLVGEWILRHDEHRRRRGPVGAEKQKPNRTAAVAAAIPATAVSVASAAASAVTNRSGAPSAEDPVGGFKATFMVGLCFYGLGTIMFWPSAVLASFPGFLISSFVVGFGLSILETAANPFIALCGPMEYAEVRLILVQGAQGVGSVLSGLLAQKVFFVNAAAANTANPTALLDVQWLYLAITMLCVSLAMFFYYMPLPEMHDAELEQVASRLPVDGTKRTSFGGLQLRTVCLIFAVFAQWTYVASQESMSVYFHHLITAWLPAGFQTTGSNNGTVSAPSPASGVQGMATSSFSPGEGSDFPPGLLLSVPNYLLICRTAFTVSRLLVGWVAYLSAKHPTARWLPAPRTILFISAALASFFALLIVLLPKNKNANLIVVPMALYFFAEGPIWPLIFAIGLRGQGARTKRAGAYITMGASGPLFWPFVMYAITERTGDIRVAFSIVVLLLAACATYPLFLTFVRDARDLTNPAPSSGRQRPADAAVADEMDDRESGVFGFRHTHPADVESAGEQEGLPQEMSAASGAMPATGQAPASSSRQKSDESAAG
ncbi:major facilitator superfamily transporter monosaccharide [Niveomyces insectorum RCEF 264]|uniref:Major facilitator superfamily transporter monosaccharide n=1 Tax=Niveomyces insectorum RCEF 264 TaxID=1081102 RepID=A0A167VF95_9HYPO|nr:major facilitator superfamily transporter monosaccharide [Niveomyces insectorum RCEF 264]